MSTHAVLQWDAQAPIEDQPLVIAENQTYETAVVIAGMNRDQYHREIITMEEREDMRGEGNEGTAASEH